MSIMATAQQTEPAPLGIIAGSTELPRIIIESCKREGRPYYVIAIEDNAEPATVENEPHSWIRLGEIGKALKQLRSEGVQELVLAGKVGRPKLANLRPDMKATLLLAKLGTNLLAGDNELLSGILEFLQSEGFTLVGVQDVLQDALTPVGQLGKHKPSRQLKGDITKGWRLAKACGELDIGQAVIIERGQILGVEGVEGTDKLIARCAAYPQHEQGQGVLVKALKPIQDARVDLPTVGVATIEGLKDAGFAGIAVEAGASLLLDKEAIIKRADELGIFILGVREDTL